MCREMGRIDGSVPVVIATFVRASGIVRKAVAAGSKDYILKPYNSDRTRKTITAILG